MAIVRVGRSKRTHDFAVYEKLIRQSSAFMNAALKEPWKEPSERVVCLPDFTSKTFDVYHLWLLTSKLHSKDEPAVDSDRAHAVSELFHELLRLQGLSQLGHYQLDNAFTDTVCDAILQCSQDLQSIGSRYPVRYGALFFKRLPEGSLTRSMIANLVAWTTTYLDVKDHNDRYSHMAQLDYPSAVLEAMARKFLSQGSSISPLREPKMSCKYHSHGDKELCYRKKGTE
jgi:hypothetical protein